MCCRCRSHTLEHACPHCKTYLCVVVVERTISASEHRISLYLLLDSVVTLCRGRLARSRQLLVVPLSQPQLPGRADLELVHPDLLGQREPNTARDPGIWSEHLKELGLLQCSAVMRNTL
jgi:hypothetical protein